MPGGPSAKPKASSPPLTAASDALAVDTPVIVARPAPVQKEITAAADEPRPVATLAHEAKETRHPSQGSEDSSTPLVTRMVDASLGDIERPENPQVGSISYLFEFN